MNTPELDQSKGTYGSCDPLRLAAVQYALAAANTANAASLGQQGVEIIIADTAEEIYDFLTGNRVKVEVTETKDNVIYANFRQAQKDNDGPGDV